MAEFATSVASNLVSKLIEHLFVPIGRQFGYVLCYKSYVQDLKSRVEKLETSRKRVQSSVEQAVHDGKSIHTDIATWLESVNEEIEKADNLLENGASEKNACFYGWLPNPAVRRPIGRKVRKMSQVIQGLHDESTNGNFQKVSYENTPKAIVTATTSAARSVNKKEDVLESWVSITKEVMKALADDKVYVIGVYGPGGVGKSKLLEDIERRVKEEKMFDVVATANVSRNPDLKEIQGEIAYALGLKLTNDEPTRGRADRLCKRLENDSNKKTLIILDNLWKKLQLKEVGIPCEDDNKVRGCKLFLTSRYRHVLHNDMVSDQEFRLNELKHEEARRIFEMTIGDRVNDPDFKPFVDGVVKNCGGLPLLIRSVAKRLKHGDLVEWRNAFNNIEFSDAKSIVELNYNDLEDDRIRSLFLVSALDSGKIFMRWTLAYCMGLGLYKIFKTIEDARDRLILDLRSLQDSSLLLDTDDMEVFKMHDIFVDVAISIASTQWNALVGREDYGFKEWSKDELRKCTTISFTYVGIDELPEKLDCPDLRMLLVYEDNPSLKIPESFFESTKKLQVLDFTSLSFTSLPSSIEYLEDLKSLCLDRCHLEDVTILGKLKGLQFLSFDRSAIIRLPKEIGELIELRFLNLTGCTKLKIIEPGVLGRLVNLEELYMEDSFDQWEAKDEVSQSNASLAELKNMKKLSTLFIAIPHFAHLPRDLPFGKLNKHKIQIGGVWDWSGKNTESRILKLKLNSSNLREEWMSKCLQKTQNLHLDGSQDGIDSIHNLCDNGFQELKHLHVQNSPLFQYVVHSMGNVQCTAFTRLESLFLKNLNSLDKICRGSLALKSFSKLKIVKVDNCGEIKHLFPLSMKRIISQLEEIEISNCHLMQHVFAYVEADEDEDGIDDDNKVKSCNLHKLILRNLPKMMSFYKTVDHFVSFFHGQQVSLPGLESLILSELPKLEEIWNSQFPSHVSNLKFLKVEDCAFLMSIFPTNLLIKLQNLEAITIERCQFIREVFNLEGLTTNGDVEILSRLTTLTLSDLPRLEHIWNKNSRMALCFQNLRVLKVQGCENLRFIFCSSMAKALQQMNEGSAGSNESPHSLFDTKVLFPSLEELKLSSMCQLKRIWHNQLHGQSFCKFAFLTVELCENLSHVFPSNSMDRLQSLSKIEVVGCPSLEALFEPVSLSAEKRQKPLELSTLKKVNLLNLPRLRDILKSDYKVNLTFPSLMEVNVRRCHSLSYLFSSTTAKSLHELVVLDVSYCNNLRGIIAMEEGKGKTVETFEFHHLTKLKLGNLKSLICFSSGNNDGDRLYPLFDEKLAFPKLEELHIEGVQQVELWNNKILMESFCYVKVLKVKQCHNLVNVIPSFMSKRLLHYMKSLTIEKCSHLRNLFTMSMAKSLGQLQYLGLGGCEEMEYIVAKEEEKLEEATEKIVIPQLVTLYLHNMPKLRSFCQGKNISEWPSLKEFTIEDCEAVKVILGDANYGKLEGCDLTYQPLLLVEKVEFSNMESMKISHMDTVEKIWVDEIASNAFSKLKTLIVEYCEKLSSIFSSNTMLIGFQNLEMLTVTDCGFLEVVFHIQDSNMSGNHSTSTFRLRELNLERLPKMKHIWSGHPHGTLTFEYLQCLKAEKCESLRNLFPSPVAKSMTRFENLEVDDCGVEEIIAEEDEGVGMSVDDLFFPRLTVLKLIELPKLRSFYRNSHTSTWPLLKELKVKHCRPISFASEIQSCQDDTTSEDQLALFSFEKVIPQLKKLRLASKDVAMMPQHYIFGNLRDLVLGCYHNDDVTFPSCFLLQRFPNLERLSVVCSSFKEIFPKDVFGRGGVNLKALGNLKQLQQNILHNLRRVWEDGSLMAEILNQIEGLTIWKCSSLSIIFPSPTSFQRLTQLRVHDCPGLVHIGTSLAVTSLVHLTDLILIDCGAMEDVVTDGGNRVEEISFPKLRLLKLDNLPSLESFSLANCAFVFPSLVSILVKQCPKMNIFCQGALRTPKLNKVFLSYEDNEGLWEGDLNTTIQTLLT